MSLNSCEANLAKSVVLPCVNVCAVSYKRDYAVIIQSIRRPAQKAFVHIILVRSLRRAFLDIGILYALVNLRIRAVSRRRRPRASRCRYTADSPDITLIGFSFCACIRYQLSNDTLPNSNAP